MGGGAGGGCGGVGVSSQVTTTVPLGATVTTGTVCRFTPSVCGAPNGRPGAATATCTGVALVPRRHATTARPVEVTPTPPSAHRRRASTGSEPARSCGPDARRRRAAPVSSLGAALSRPRPRCHRPPRRPEGTPRYRPSAEAGQGRGRITQPRLQREVARDGSPPSAPRTDRHRRPQRSPAPASRAATRAAAPLGGLVSTEHSATAQRRKPKLGAAVRVAYERMGRSTMLTSRFERVSTTKTPPLA